MTSVPTTVEPAKPGANPDRPAAGGATPSGRLVGLLHKLIGFGRNLLDTLRGQPSAEAVFDARTRFGIRDIAEIVSRIINGLRLADELQERVERAAPRLDRPPPARAVRRVPPDQPPPAPPTEADASVRLPTAREIAAKARTKPIGAVIMDICADLGLRPSDPMWREIALAVMSHGGSFPGLMRDMFRRTALTNFFPPDTSLLLPTPELLAAAMSGLPPNLNARPP